MDSLNNLPTDTSETTIAEQKILQKYFGNNKTNKKVWSECKGVIFATILFVLLSTTFFDSCLDYLPNTQNLFVKLGLKILIFATSLYVILIMTN